MKTPLQYVPGQDAKLDELAARYREIEKDARAFAVEHDDAERSIKDPLGFAAAAAAPRGDPWIKSKTASEKMVQFLRLLIAEQGLSPEEIIYAQELMSLNIINAADIPLTPLQVNTARQKAFEYYKAHAGR